MPKVGLSAALSAVPAVVAVPVSKVLRVVLTRTDEVAPAAIPETVTGKINPFGVPSVTVPVPETNPPDHCDCAL